MYVEVWYQVIHMDIEPISFCQTWPNPSVPLGLTLIYIDQHIFHHYYLIGNACGDLVKTPGSKILFTPSVNLQQMTNHLHINPPIIKEK